MLKFIGQHIVDLIARFRSNVFAEADLTLTLKNAASFPNTTSTRTTAAFTENGTLVQDSKVIVKKVS